MRSLTVLLLIIVWLSSCVHDPFLPEPPDSVDPLDTTSIDTVMGNPCDPDSVYFENDVLPILLSNCAFSGCHGDGSAQDGVELSNYANVLSTGSVVPFDASESNLFEAITETDPDKIMPPPPASSLTPEQISTIAIWISQGAENNSCYDCDTATVTFSGIVSGIIQSNCQGCHSGAAPAAGLSLISHSDIATLALNGSLLGTIQGDPGFVPMPFGQPPLTDCAQRQIEIWVLDGAPNN